MVKHSLWNFIYFYSYGNYALSALSFAYFIWPKNDDLVLSHTHHDLPAGHEHVVNHSHNGEHAHEYVIDDYHHKWPK